MSLRIENISKSFGKVNALDSVSLELTSNETLALLGESGSGKSTLLRIIAGLEHPNQGNVFFGENQLNGKGFTRPEKRNFGLVFQNYALFPHLTVAKNIAFGVKTNKNKVVAQLLEKIQLTGYEKRFPSELSGGQQQRVALARALATNPQMLLLDEPFSGLDRSLRSSVRSEIQGLIKSSNIPSILVTHEMEDAIAIADRIAVLQNGKLVQIGTAEELYNNPVSLYVAQLTGEIFNLGNGNYVRKEDILLGSDGDEISVQDAKFHSGKYNVKFEWKGIILEGFSEVANPVKVSIVKTLEF